MISSAEKFQLASDQSELRNRVMVQAHREAVYRIEQESYAAGEPGYKACQAIWQNVSNFGFPLTLGVLNGPLIAKEDEASITDADIESAVQVIFPLFISVYFPE